MDENGHYSMKILDRLYDIVGENHAFEEREGGKYGDDWTRSYVFKPLAVVRPADTQQVSEVVKLANAEKIGLVSFEGKYMPCRRNLCRRGIEMSLERLNTIREMRKSSCIAVVESGVVLTGVHHAVNAYDIIFPMNFGA